mgnify:FL=1
MNQNDDDELIAEIRRLNANLEVLLSASQGQLLARLVEILGDLRQIAASTLGYEVKE